MTYVGMCVNREFGECSFEFGYVNYKLKGATNELMTAWEFGMERCLNCVVGCVNFEFGECKH